MRLDLSSEGVVKIYFIQMSSQEFSKELKAAVDIQTNACIKKQNKTKHWNIFINHTEVFYKYFKTVMLTWRPNVNIR